MEQHRSPRPVAPRRAHTIPTAAALRSHRRSVVAWALTHGHPVDRDALSVILGHTTSTAGHGTTTADRRTWTTDRVEQLLWSGVTDWCRTRGVGFPAPARVVDTLTTYLTYLGAHDQFAPGSDTPAQLRRSVAARRRDAARPAHLVRPDPARREVVGDRHGVPGGRLATVTPIT